MSSVNNLSPVFNQNIGELKQLANEVDKSSHNVQKKLAKIKGRSAVRLSRKKHIPKWAAKHIDLHKRLEKAVNKANEEGVKIPADIVKSLGKSKKTMKKLVNKGNYSAFLKFILPGQMLTPLNPNDKPSHSNLTEWKMNFGLLYSAYQRTQNEDTKETIRFLMANYLTKAAFLNESTGINISEQCTRDYEKMLQLGMFTMGGVYHRTADTVIPILQILELEGMIGSPQEKAVDLIPMDTKEVQGLYNIGFVTTPDITKPEEIVEILVSQFEAHIGQFDHHNPNEDDNPNHIKFPVMEFPVLLDITEQIGQSLITQGDPQKIQEYEDKQQVVRAQVNEIVRKAATIVKNKYSDRQDIQDKAEDYIKTNLAVVSRTQVNDHVAVMGLHKNMFNDTDFNESAEQFENPLYVKRHAFLAEKVKEWAGHAAIGVGAVNLRRVIADIHTDPSHIPRIGRGQAVNYTVPGRTDVMVYSEPHNITSTNTFKMLTRLAETPDPNIGEGQVVLAKATVKMMKTLMDKITKEEWIEKQSDLAVRELTQTAVFRIQQHLGAAVHHAHDLRQFGQAIDRTHAELTTLLALYSPFDIDSFDENYAKFIKPNLPDAMKPTLVGLGKSAMNVFAGINAAVLRKSPHPIRVCGAHSYYEEAMLVGANRTLKEVLENPDIKKVDLYVTEFYHNIDIDPNHTNYQKGTVIQDIKSIFTQKPDTNQLTVVIDGTIDFAQSDDIKAVFKEFEQEIKDGKLNIAVIRSGQKFDMLGFDNYFGSPFYMVNNGDEKWNEFNKIKTEEAFRTDELSQQFFTWMAETGPEIIDQYKKQIFANARAILDMVPAKLQPGEGKEVCVCNFEEGVKTVLLDIKIDLADEVQKDELRRWAQQRFMELFVENDKLVYRRGSFGFAHANITWIDPKMRINPGLNSEENKLYQQFFNELAAKVEEMQQSGAS